MADDIILDPVLSYVEIARNTSSKRASVSAIVERFSIDQIRDARSALWEKGGLDPKSLPGRRDGKNRSAAEALVNDIMEGFEKLDNTGHLPTFALRAQDILIFPRLLPEEINVSSLAERLGDVEEAVKSLRQIVDYNLKEQQAQLMSHLKRLSVQSVSMEVPEDAQMSSVWDVSRNEAQSESSTMVKAPISATPELENQQLDEDPQVPHQDVPGLSIADMVKQMAANAAPLQELKKVAKSQKKKRKKMVGQKGTAHSTSTNLRTGRKTFMLQLTNLNLDMKENDIKDYIVGIDKDVAPVSVVDTSSPEWGTKRFVVTFALNAKEKVLEPSFWPGGVYFRQHFPARTPRDRHG